MLDLIDLIEKSSRTIHVDFQKWFHQFPAAASWNIFSDFSIGDKSKQNDAYSFVVVLKHDTDDNISSYIAASAPSDLKSSRTPPIGLLDYLCCPVAFSLNFVVARESSNLRIAVTKETMSLSVSALRQIVMEWTREEPSNENYYSTLDNRLKSLASELSRNQPSLNLLRRIFLVSSFARFRGQRVSTAGLTRD